MLRLVFKFGYNVFVFVLPWDNVYSEFFFCCCCGHIKLMPNKVLETLIPYKNISTNICITEEREESLSCANRGKQNGERVVFFLG